jgi:hypothetical protein
MADGPPFVDPETGAGRVLIDVAASGTTLADA